MQMQCFPNGILLVATSVDGNGTVALCQYLFSSALLSVYITTAPYDNRPSLQRVLETPTGLGLRIAGLTQLVGTQGTTEVHTLPNPGRTCHNDLFA